LTFSIKGVDSRTKGLRWYRVVQKLLGGSRPLLSSTSRAYGLNGVTA